MLNAELRMENEEFKIFNNVQDIESKFHSDLKEHMDLLKLKIELPETRKYTEMISWSHCSWRYNEKSCQLMEENSLERTR